MSFKDKIFNNQSPWGSAPGGGILGGGGNSMPWTPRPMESVQYKLAFMVLLFRIGLGIIMEMLFLKHL